MRLIKDTLHRYKGFEIIGTYLPTQGGYVLGGRHFKEGGIKRNYNIKHNGRYFVSPQDIFPQLKDAKEYIDYRLKQ